LFRYDEEMAPSVAIYDGAAAPGGRPRGGSVTKKDMKKYLAPPCPKGALRREALAQFFPFLLVSNELNGFKVRYSDQKKGLFRKH
jgi:hypothetical protein